ncbi:hypothetical protein [Salinilacihabitans rarus]|uniref:hypothetical protein n=1 Tax=Salinilacihabitans rarus TaxID=2961596 RepID=UPI0020C8B815|nr:hypothetical protein [Salinilacihabitans rarus]
MTAATERGVGPFESTFNLSAAVVGALAILLGVVAGWTGYQGGELLVVGRELTILEGAVALTFGAGVGVLALWIAFYMEPGFGDDHGHEAGDGAEEPVAAEAAED